jgi:ABC-type antimicrobial peptide transport system permease subunit
VRSVFDGRGQRAYFVWGREGQERRNAHAHAGDGPETIPRSLRRHWGYALLNGFGLAIGIAASLLIVLHVTYERSYDRFGQVGGLVAVLTILVAALGLVGLAAVSATRRAGEIGVRKVLGATVPHVIGLLSKDFLKLVLWGSLLATPLVWLGMEQWLRHFAQRTSISGTAFLAATGFGILVALLAVSTQAWRAARTDPATVLRSE